MSHNSNYASTPNAYFSATFTGLASGQSYDFDDAFVVDTFSSLATKGYISSVTRCDFNGNGTYESSENCVVSCSCNTANGWTDTEPTSGVYVTAVTDQSFASTISGGSTLSSNQTQLSGPSIEDGVTTSSYQTSLSSNTTSLASANSGSSYAAILASNGTSLAAVNSTYSLNGPKTCYKKTGYYIDCTVKYSESGSAEPVNRYALPSQTTQNLAGWLSCKWRYGSKPSTVTGNTADANLSFNVYMDVTNGQIYSENYNIASRKLVAVNTSDSYSKVYLIDRSQYAISRGEAVALTDDDVSVLAKFTSTNSTKVTLSTGETVQISTTYIPYEGCPSGYWDYNNISNYLTDCSNEYCLGTADYSYFVFGSFLRADDGSGCYKVQGCERGFIDSTLLEASYDSEEGYDYYPTSPWPIRIKPQTNGNDYLTYDGFRCVAYECIAGLTQEEMYGGSDMYTREENWDYALNFGYVCLGTPDVPCSSGYYGDTTPDPKYFEYITDSAGCFKVTGCKSGYSSTGTGEGATWHGSSCYKQTKVECPDDYPYYYSDPSSQQDTSVYEYTTGSGSNYQSGGKYYGCYYIECQNPIFYRVEYTDEWGYENYSEVEGKLVETSSSGGYGYSTPLVSRDEQANNAVSCYFQARPTHIIKYYDTYSSGGNSMSTSSSNGDETCYDVVGIDFVQGGIGYKTDGGYFEYFDGESPSGTDVSDRYKLQSIDSGISGINTGYICSEEPNTGYFDIGGVSTSILVDDGLPQTFRPTNDSGTMLKCDGYEGAKACVYKFKDIRSSMQGAKAGDGWISGVGELSREPAWGNCYFNRYPSASSFSNVDSTHLTGNGPKEYFTFSDMINGGQNRYNDIKYILQSIEQTDKSNIKTIDDSGFVTITINSESSAEIYNGNICSSVLSIDNPSIAIPSALNSNDLSFEFSIYFEAPRSVNSGGNYMAALSGYEDSTTLTYKYENGKGTWSTNNSGTTYISSGASVEYRYRNKNIGGQTSCSQPESFILKDTTSNITNYLKHPKFEIETASTGNSGLRYELRREYHQTGQDLPYYDNSVASVYSSPVDYKQRVQSTNRWDNRCRDEYIPENADEFTGCINVTGIGLSVMNPASSSHYWHRTSALGVKLDYIKCIDDNGGERTYRTYLDLSQIAPRLTIRPNGDIYEELMLDLYAGETYLGEYTASVYAYPSESMDALGFYTYDNSYYLYWLGDMMDIKTYKDSLETTTFYDATTQTSYNPIYNDFHRNAPLVGYTDALGWSQMLNPDISEPQVYGASWYMYIDGNIYLDGQYMFDYYNNLIYEYDDEDSKDYCSKDYYIDKPNGTYFKYDTETLSDGTQCYKVTGCKSGYATDGNSTSYTWHNYTCKKIQCSSGYDYYGSGGANQDEGLFTYQKDPTFDRCYKATGCDDGYNSSAVGETDSYYTTNMAAFSSDKYARNKYSCYRRPKITDFVVEYYMEQNKYPPKVTRTYNAIPQLKIYDDDHEVTNRYYISKIKENAHYTEFSCEGNHQPTMTMTVEQSNFLTSTSKSTELYFNCYTLMVDESSNGTALSFEYNADSSTNISFYVTNGTHYNISEVVDKATGVHLPVGDDYTGMNITLKETWGSSNVKNITLKFDNGIYYSGIELSSLTITPPGSYQQTLTDPNEICQYAQNITIMGSAIGETVTGELTDNYYNTVTSTASLNSKISFVGSGSKCLAYYVGTPTFSSTGLTFYNPGTSTPVSSTSNPYLNGSGGDRLVGYTHYLYDQQPSSDRTTVSWSFNNKGNVTTIMYNNIVSSATITSNDSSIDL